MNTYEQADSPGIGSPGKDCKHCGRAGHEHDLKRVQHDDGTYSYDYVCPEGSA